MVIVSPYLIDVQHSICTNKQNYRKSRNLVYITIMFIRTTELNQVSQCYKILQDFIHMGSMYMETYFNSHRSLKRLKLTAGLEKLKCVS